MCLKLDWLLMWLIWTVNVFKQGFTFLYEKILAISTELMSNTCHCLCCITTVYFTSHTHHQNFRVVRSLYCSQCMTPFLVLWYLEAIVVSKQHDWLVTGGQKLARSFTRKNPVWKLSGLQTRFSQENICEKWHRNRQKNKMRQDFLETTNMK